jgi:hypothetical protein
MNTCTLLNADEPGPCNHPCLLQIEDVTGAREWGCPRHAMFALLAIDGARLVQDLRTTANGGQP